tara:strand:+ start:51 stop:1091 length:1041 start_codon:yes stop_codon:yes gene_type:complete
MAEIINEVPEELEMEGEEVEVDLNKKESKSEKSTADVERVKPQEPKQEELELEIEDDTPPEDQGKEPLPQEIVEEVEKDTLEDYSERVKQRMAQLKKMHHDERREKEKADRERAEAVRVAEQYIQQNQQLKNTLSSGEQEYITTLQSRFESDLAVAQRDYREAYDSGDTNKIIEAQTKMNDAQYKLSSAKNMQPQYNFSGQEEQNSVQRNLEALRPKAAAPGPDTKATAWQSENDWFGKDEQMTSLALGVHEQLVRSGVDPTSDDYYRRIDETMQKRFPENFGDNSLEPEEKPAQRKPSNVVAPATRSTSPKKVRLTKTQVALAKKLKLTPEQYAREITKLENTNG